MEQKRLDWERAQALYKDGIIARQDYDAKKAAFDRMWRLDQAARMNQAKAKPTPHAVICRCGQATLRSNQDVLTRPISTAPFDGMVTNLPVREGETVVMGIQNAGLHADDAGRY